MIIIIFFYIGSLKSNSPNENKRFYDGHFSPSDRTRYTILCIIYNALTAYVYIYILFNLCIIYCYICYAK